MVSFAISAAIATPISPSSLLSLSKTFPLSPHRLSLRLSPPSSPLTSRFVAAVAGEKSSDDTELVVEVGGGKGGGGGEGRFGGGGGSDSNSDGGDEESGKEEEMKMSGMSMSQKLTLGFAALVGGDLFLISFFFRFWFFASPLGKELTFIFYHNFGFLFS